MKKLLFGVFLLVAMLFVVIPLVLNKVGADNLLPNQEMTRTRLTGSFASSFHLIKYTKDSSVRWRLEQRDFYVFRKSLELTGFEDEVVPCNIPNLTLEGNDYLCLKGIVGAHSQNLQLIRSNDLNVIQFDDGVINLPNITSDVPFMNTSKDRSLLTIDQRDYDLNPLTDGIRFYYLFERDVFRFDKSEKIQYDGTNNELVGDI